MASAPWPLQTNVIDPFEVEVNVKDIAIGGKLVAVSLELNPLDEMTFANPDEYKRAVKQKIASELARAMIESNLIEFTQMLSSTSMNKVIHARCYLAPDSQVKILRIHSV